MALSRYPVPEHPALPDTGKTDYFIHKNRIDADTAFYLYAYNDVNDSIQIFSGYYTQQLKAIGSNIEIKLYVCYSPYTEWEYVETRTINSGNMYYTLYSIWEYQGVLCDPGVVGRNLGSSFTVNADLYEIRTGTIPWKDFYKNDSYVGHTMESNPVWTLLFNVTNFVVRVRIGTPPNTAYAYYEETTYTPYMDVDCFIVEGSKTIWYTDSSLVADPTPAYVAPSGKDVYLGETQISKIYLGDTEVTNLYIGDTEI